MYALYKDGKQVSKMHANKEAVMVEAFERKAVWQSHADFPGDKEGLELMEGYEIRELDNE